MLFLPTETEKSLLLSTQFTRAASNKRRSILKDNKNSLKHFGTIITANNHSNSGVGGQNKKSSIVANNAYFGIKRGSEVARNLITYMGNI